MQFLTKLAQLRPILIPQSHGIGQNFDRMYAAGHWILLWWASSSRAGARRTVLLAYMSGNEQEHLWTPVTFWWLVGNKGISGNIHKYILYIYIIGSRFPSPGSYAYDPRL